MKRSTKIALIVGGSLIAAVGVLALLGAIIWSGTLFGGSTSAYATKVNMLESAQKSFAIGQTAEIGPYDVKVVSLQQKYAPSEAEATTIDKVLARYKRLSDPETAIDHSGYSLTDETGQYVLLTLNVKNNTERSDYNDINTDTGSWLGQLGEAELGEIVPLVIAPDPELYTTEKEMAASAKTEEGLTMTLLYRVPVSVTAFTLEYDITVFTKVSAIVGTEGMPRKTYEYTIGIQ